MRRRLYGLVAVSGLAGLTWEVLWQHHAALALGISALGTALTLACTMAGLAVGSWGMGAWLRRRGQVDPLKVYGGLEIVIGLSGLALGPAFAALEHMDAGLYAASPTLAPWAHGLGVALLLGPPAIAMGGTVPLFQVLGREADTSIARLYGLNTAGAACGVLGAAFVLLPAFGVQLTASLAALLNLGVGATAWISGMGPAEVPEEPEQGEPLGRLATVVALSTGFATFALEVSWFRSLRAAFQSTTDSFAIILFAVLLPLAAGARLAAALGNSVRTLSRLLALAGLLVLLASPLIERLDATALWGANYWSRTGIRLGLALLTMGPAILALGTCLPWLLERRVDARASGRLYAFNTAGAVLGSVVAGWILLPTIGATRSAWVVGALLLALGALVGPKRGLIAGLAVAGLAFAFVAETGVGRVRVQGAHLPPDHKVIASREAPDTSVSVIAWPNGVRELVIDGFQTSGEAQTGHYMVWMGRLPALLHPKPEAGLVICFGTGQTTNAVRREGITHLDVVDVSADVLDLAPLFPSNEGVLKAPGVFTHVMDGRAWLRRTEQRYDLVTLEPMAPTFAGTNALYSRRFYELMATRLKPGAVVAQWLPFHIVTPQEATAIAAAMHAVFPDGALWIDPVDRTGIILGRMGTQPGTPWTWPGLARPNPRDLDAARIRAGLVLEGAAFAAYASLGEVVTDDNQLLAYGAGRRDIWAFGSNEGAHQANLRIVEGVRRATPRGGPPPPPR